jgi:hypothetical protein
MFNPAGLFVTALFVFLRFNNPVSYACQFPASRPRLATYSEGSGKPVESRSFSSRGSAAILNSRDDE